eukprot:scaffold313633_cov31-Tisochrysis_lutea.AAC.5
MGITGSRTRRWTHSLIVARENRLTVPSRLERVTTRVCPLELSRETIPIPNAEPPGSRATTLTASIVYKYRR